MNKNQIFKRAKGSYIITIDGKKYYDFRYNNNILGFSNKKITKIVKNGISSVWNLKSNGLEHKRFKEFIKELFGNEYEPFFTLSIKTFFVLFFAYLDSINEQCNCNSKFMIEWLQNNIANSKNFQSTDNFTIIDMAWNLLFNQKNSVQNNTNFVLNYYWYPDIDIKTSKSQIIVLPSFFSGGFDYVIILLHKKDKNFSRYLESTDNISSLYLKNSMNTYYQIKKLKNNQNPSIRIKSDKIIQANRIFITKDIENKENLVKDFLSKNILINNCAPYYNYLPIIMEESQIKYLNRLKI